VIDVAFVDEVDSHFSLHDAASAAHMREGVLDVWEGAFDPVTDVSAWTDEVWDRHRAREDYRLVTAEAQLMGKRLR
jgi:hypothetical protein